MNQTDLTYPAFSLRFVDFAAQFCFRRKFHSKRGDTKVKFDSDGIFQDQSQFFATHSSQRDCFILYRQQITSNTFSASAKVGNFC